MDILFSLKHIAAVRVLLAIAISRQKRRKEQFISAHSLKVQTSSESFSDEPRFVPTVTATPIKLTIEMNHHSTLHFYLCGEVAGQIA